MTFIGRAFRDGKYLLHPKKFMVLRLTLGFGLGVGYALRNIPVMASDKISHPWKADKLPQRSAMDMGRYRETDELAEMSDGRSQAIHAHHYYL